MTATFLKILRGLLFLLLVSCSFAQTSSMRVGTKRAVVILPFSAENAKGQKLLLNTTSALLVERVIVDSAELESVRKRTHIYKVGTPTFICSADKHIYLANVVNGIPSYDGKSEGMLDYFQLPDEFERAVVEYRIRLASGECLPMAKLLVERVVDEETDSESAAVLPEEDFDEVARLQGQPNQRGQAGRAPETVKR